MFMIKHEISATQFKIEIVKNTTTTVQEQHQVLEEKHQVLEEKNRVLEEKNRVLEEKIKMQENEVRIFAMVLLICMFCLVVMQLIKINGI